MPFVGNKSNEIRRLRDLGHTPKEIHERTGYAMPTIWSACKHKDSMLKHIQALERQFAEQRELIKEVLRLLRVQQGIPTDPIERRLSNIEP